jgi:trk system potassium uptake protein TrkH
MTLAGVNFALLYRAITGNFHRLRRDSEFHFYLLLLGSAGILLALLMNQGSIEERVRHGFFQAISVITTTGFASVDFNLWPELLKFFLLTLMFFGGCAGSTGGSIKIVRSLLSFKFILREILKAIHPSAVIPVRLGRRIVSEGAMSGIIAFSILYVTTFAIGSALLMIELYLEGVPIGVLEGVSMVASSLGNVGPAFGMAGPMASYAELPDLSKELLIVLMWAGRLELFPVIVLMTKSYWKR